MNIIINICIGVVVLLIIIVVIGLCKSVKDLEKHIQNKQINDPLIQPNTEVTM